MTEHHRHAAGHSPHPEESPSPAEHWEQRYCEADRVWSGKANATMTSIVGEFPPGRAIDLGCGEGGDVLWLAEQGWQAHGLDISTVAIDRARSEAVARGLERATFTAADLSTWRPEPDSVELVTAAFFQSHVALDRIEILRRAATAIRPGGHLVVISHAQPPSWSSAHQHEGPQLVSARDDAAELALPSDAWVIEAADERSRPAVGHDGEPSELIDAVLVLRRR